MPVLMTYFGGKFYLAKDIIAYFPSHYCYVEVFGGAAHVLFQKPPSPVEVYNDIDFDLVNLFRVLKDEEKFKKFLRKVYFTLYSRAEFEFCRDNYDKTDDEIERAYRYFVKMRMSFSGKGSQFSYAITRSVAGTWANIVDTLPVIRRRLSNVIIENKDFRKLIADYDDERTLFYLDPPYVHETRVIKKVYKNEMTLEDHKELVSILLNIKGKAILSGYWHEVYLPLEQNGWQRIDFDVPAHSRGITKWEKQKGIRERPRRVDSIWLSPNIVEERGSLFQWAKRVEEKDTG